MPSLTIPTLIAELRRDEGDRQFPYRDTKGKITIGTGRNLTDVGLSVSERTLLLSNDIGSAIASLTAHYPWWTNLSDARQRVLVNMAFNMGIGGLGEFTGMLAAIVQGRYSDAAADMLASEWAGQVGDRAVRLATMMKDG